MLFDTHAHLDQEDFDNDRDEVIARAHDAGVADVVGPAGGLRRGAAVVVVALLLILALIVLDW